MYTLYYSPGACSLVAHALLAQAKQPYDTVKIDLQKGEGRTPEYLKINPRGQVPVLIEDGKIRRESAVIALHLAEKHNSPLLPKDVEQRRAMEEWLAFYNSTLHQAYSAYFLMWRRLEDEQAKEAALSLVVKRINMLWREVEEHLATHRYLCGDVMTLPDLFHAVIANWSTVLAHKIELGPNILRLCSEVAQLPHFKQALEEESINYRLSAA